MAFGVPLDRWFREDLRPYLVGAGGVGAAHRIMRRYRLTAVHVATTYARLPLPIARRLAGCRLNFDLPGLMAAE